MITLYTWPNKWYNYICRKEVRTIIIKPDEVPTNPKLTNVDIELNNKSYKIILGLKYFYLLDFTKKVSHRVPQNITLLNLFTDVLAKDVKAKENIVKTIKDISIQETKDNFTKKFINKS